MHMFIYLCALKVELQSGFLFKKKKIISFTYLNIYRVEHLNIQGSLFLPRN